MKKPKHNPAAVYWTTLTIEQQVEAVCIAKRWVSPEERQYIHDTLEYHRKYAPSLN